MQFDGPPIFNVCNLAIILKLVKVINYLSRLYRTFISLIQAICEREN